MSVFSDFINNNHNHVIIVLITFGALRACGEFAVYRLLRKDM